jgi:serine protease AprX
VTKVTRRLIDGVLIALACLWVSGTIGSTGARADNGRPKLDAALQRATAGAIRVIATTHPGATDAVSERLRGRGRGVRTHALINAVTTEIPVGELPLLEGDPEVAHVSLDATVISTGVAGATNTPAPNSLLATLGLPLEGRTGRGVGVAVVDSGVQPNGDLSNLRSYDFTGEGPFDDHGHGTHLAGLIASKGALSQGAYAGIAPRVRIVSLKVLNALGFGSTSTVIEALEFATVNRSALGIDIINLSIGHPIFERAATDPLVRAVEAAVRAGIVVIVSAGNVGRNLVTGAPGYAGILSPANAASAITVGALDTRQTARRSDDDVAVFSSRGPTWYDARPKPDLVAPGRSLVSNAVVGATLFTRYEDQHVGGNGQLARFLSLSGTSMAAAVTSGTVALMIEAARASGRTLSPGVIKTVLAYTSIPVPGADVLAQGHGALNAAGAIAMTVAIAASAAETPLDPMLIPATTIGGDTSLWTQAQGWDETVVWGNADWDETVVWGNVDWDETVVWGNDDWDSTVVWGNIEWDETVVWGNADDTR